MAHGKKKYLGIVTIMLVFLLAGAIFWLYGSRRGGVPPPSLTTLGCRTPTPSLEVLDVVNRALEKTRNDSPTGRAAASVTIPVHFHIITNTSGEGTISEDVLKEQIEALNKAFSGTADPTSPGANTPFRFSLASFETIPDNDLFDMPFNENSPSTEEKNAMAHNIGAPSALNIYIARLGEGVLGWARMPFQLPNGPEPVPGLDGVVIKNTTLTGGSSPFDQGDTVTHEVGHWLGLLHVFAFGCNDPGDLVADTPFQLTNASADCSSSDSCPSKPFNDPIQNFMNTTTDACMCKFTVGQSTRMDTYHMTFRN